MGLGTLIFGKDSETGQWIDTAGNFALDKVFSDPNAVSSIGGGSTTGGFSIPVSMPSVEEKLGGLRKTILVTTGIAVLGGTVGLAFILSKKR